MEAANFEHIDHLADQGETASIMHMLGQLVPLASAEDRAVRTGMVNRVLAGDSLQELFPDTPISEATNRFLHLTTRAEIAEAQAALEQRALLQENRMAFAMSLCGDLAEAERRTCQERFVQVQAAARSQTTVDTFLRHLNGENIKLIAADYLLSQRGANKALKRAIDIWNGDDVEAMQDIMSRLTPRFPRLKATIAEELTAHVPSLNTEITIIAKRLGEQDFAYLAQSLVEAGMRARQVLYILESLNATSTKIAEEALGWVSSSTRAASSKYVRLNGPFYRAFKIRPAQRRRPSVYENSEEATKIIEKALTSAAVRRSSEEVVQRLSEEEVVDYAKALEAGVYADRLLAQRAEQPYPEASPEQLRQIRELGNTALHQLLASHVPLVAEIASKEKDRLNSPRDLDELTMAGMRGLLRAVRKYDYTTGIRLSTYAFYWILQTVQRDVFYKDWQVSAHQGGRLQALKVQRSRLNQKLQRAVTRQDLLEATGLSRNKLEELLALERQIGNRLRHKAEETQPSQSLRQKTRFSSEVSISLERLLADQPFELEALKMHFGQQFTFTEIASIFNVSEADAQRYVKTALEVLGKRMQPSELRELLQDD